jgi:hypothetical protein
MRLRGAPTEVTRKNVTYAKRMRRGVKKEHDDADSIKVWDSGFGGNAN